MGRTFEVFGREWSLFMALSAPVAVLYAAQAVLVRPEDIAANLAFALVISLVGVFTTAACVLAADAIADDRPIGLVEAVRRSVPGAFRLLGLLIVFAVAAVVFALPMALALLLVADSPDVSLLITGLWTLAVLVIFVPLIRLTPSYALVVLERAGPIAGLRRTWSLTRGRTIAVFGIVMILGLAILPAVWGAGLLAVEPGPAAAIGSGLMALVTSAVLSIGATLLYRDLTPDARPAVARVVDADGATTPRRAGRGVGLALVLGVGIVLMIVGFSVFGSRIGDLLDLPDAGTVVAGRASNPADPCAPGEPATTFQVGEPIWIGGYFREPIPSGSAGSVTVLRDGEPFAELDDLRSDSFLPLVCYAEAEPWTDEPPGSYEVVIRFEGRVIASGAFTVTD